MLGLEQRILRVLQRREKETHGIVGGEALGGGELEVVGCAEDFFGFFEGVFDFAGGEEGRCCCVLLAINMNHSECQVLTDNVSYVVRVDEAKFVIVDRGGVVCSHRSLEISQSWFVSRDTKRTNAELFGRYQSTRYPPIGFYRLCSLQGRWL